MARGEKKLKGLVDELGEGHRYLVADLTDMKDLAGVSRDVEENNYSLLVNNAGYAIYERF